MSRNPFIDAQRRLRNGWWIAIFFLMLAAMLVPLLILSQQEGSMIPVGEQALLVVIASWICQRLRRRPFTEITGPFDRRWLRELLLGMLLGGLVMLVPALFLRVLGLVHWQWNGQALSGLGAGLLVYVGVAVAEELLFRGFIFQRFIDGTGAWPAQLLLGAYFVLTHSGTLATAGEAGLLAMTNIFIASILFGLAFLRTRSLAMPLGIHFAANFMQGSILGFGVSGTDAEGALMTVRGSGPAWMTGGAFGLEASVPGFVMIVIATVLLYRWKGELADV